MLNNAIDGDIGYFGNEIDTTGLDDSEDTNFGSIKLQVGCFVFLDGPGAIVMSSHQIRTVSDNEIGRTGLANLVDIEIDDVKPQVRRFVLPDGPDVTVLVTHRFFDRFLFP